MRALSIVAVQPWRRSGSRLPISNAVSSGARALLRTPVRGPVKESAKEPAKELVKELVKEIVAFGARAVFRPIPRVAP